MEGLEAETEEEVVGVAKAVPGVVEAVVAKAAAVAAAAAKVEAAVVVEVDSAQVGAMAGDLAHLIFGQARI